MKIDVVNTNVSIDFKDVRSGQVFMWEGNFLIRTSCEFYDINQDRYNTIRLEDGDFFSFTPLDQVTLCPNAKLVIEL